MSPAVSTAPPWRIFLAFLVAPAVAALLFAALYPAYAGLSVYADRVFWTALFNAATATFPATLMLGLPLYVAFRPRLALTPLNAGLAGAFVLAVPAVLLAFMPSPLAHAAGQTPAETFIFLVEAAAIGGASGLVFWLIARRRSTPPPTVLHRPPGATLLKPMPGLSDLERAILEAIAALHPEFSDTLTRQIAAASVVKRENTGAGLVVSFSVAPGTPPLAVPSFSSGNVVTTVSGARLWFCAVMKGGYLDFIDGCDMEAIGFDTTGIDFLTAPFTQPRPPP